ncbi:unnamed protein product [Oikopleura dioica]|uniref:Uncharacterized protein n=1 Tax=Oikopleura dioica TaxID=34765 RepID=E4XDI8_OIKDI|nr:unnamed protein product [Oikopleura dioica]
MSTACLAGSNSTCNTAGENLMSQLNRRIVKLRA